MIELREFIASDADALVELASNKNVSRYLSSDFPFPYTADDAQWWIGTGSKEGIQRAILLNGQLVGSVGATPGIGEREKQALVGYWLGEPYWGRGIAVNALRILVSDVFENTKIVRVCAWVYQPNNRSSRVLEKAGFEHEATLAKSLYKHDKIYDELIYSKINS
jgi:[ribosomal protein S5]-alanine N-acetyltransferase